MSSKDSDKKIVGQPLFKQIVDFMPHNKFDSLAQRHGANPLLESLSWSVLEARH